MILTVSRMDAEKRANPGYRAFFANGFNVTPRARALLRGRSSLEWTAAGRAKRRDVRPRGHRGGLYPFLRAAMCVFVRDLIVYGVLSDMMKGRPAIYATFSSYDEVAHHSGLERSDTLEALRKLDQQFGRIERARRYAPRPYEIVVLSDHGQTQGATFKQRNGYGLDELVERSLSARERRRRSRAATSRARWSDTRSARRPDARARSATKNDVSDRDVVVLGSGNLGLVYLMEERRRLTLEEIERAPPRPAPGAARAPARRLAARPLRASTGPSRSARAGAHYLADGRVEGEDPLASFSPNAAQHLRRTDGFAHVADIMVGSFYDPTLDEGCAFEELISFHGGIGRRRRRGRSCSSRSALPAPEEPTRRRRGGARPPVGLAAAAQRRCRRGPGRLAGARADALGGVFGVVGGQQALLLLTLREEEEDERRAEQDRDDAGRVGPLVALQERRLGRGDDLLAYCGYCCATSSAPGERLGQLVLDAVADLLRRAARSRRPRPPRSRR